MKKINNIKFPKFQNINVNMMPIIAGDNNSVPPYLKQYIPLIEACNLSENIKGEIIYLTVRENFVERNQTQSRGGIHTERWKFPENHKTSQQSFCWGGGRWGGGISSEKLLLEFSWQIVLMKVV